MITEVYARSRSWANENIFSILENNGHTFFISIHDTYEGQSKPVFTPFLRMATLGDGSRHPRKLALNFSDIEKQYQQVLGGPYESKLMTQGQAREAVDFLRPLIETRGNYILYVNCLAGVSRSGAFARFVANRSGISDEWMAENNPVIYPNFHVLKLLSEEWDR